MSRRLQSGLLVVAAALAGVSVAASCFAKAFEIVAEMWDAEDVDYVAQTWLEMAPDDDETGEAEG